MFGRVIDGGFSTEWPIPRGPHSIYICYIRVYDILLLLYTMGCAIGEEINVIYR